MRQPFFIGRKAFPKWQHAGYAVFHTGLFIFLILKLAKLQLPDYHRTA